MCASDVISHQMADLHLRCFPAISVNISLILQVNANFHLNAIFLLPNRKNRRRIRMHVNNPTEINAR